VVVQSTLRPRAYGAGMSSEHARRRIFSDGGSGARLALVSISSLTESLLYPEQKERDHETMSG
jgi:hypothetical protein